jgi:hypothetical protein
MTEKRYNLAKIRDLLLNGFDDLELRRLCHDVPDFRPVYDKLAENTGKGRIVDCLLEFANRQMMIDDLLTLAKGLNPARYEHHGPYPAEGYSAACPGDGSHVAQTEGTSPRGRSATKLQLILDLDLRDVDSTYRRLLRYGLAGFLEIPPEAVRIVKVERGSVKVTVQLPTESAWLLLYRYAEALTESAQNLPRRVLERELDAALAIEDEASRMEALVALAPYLTGELLGVLLDVQLEDNQADLREAQLKRAKLIRAELRRDDLRGADLSTADLSDADLSDADLSEAT